MGDSYRIKTELGINKSINIQLDQEFEFLEILSLKIQQTDIYTRSCADYGVLVGRVTANNGFGIPNARVSIFIPIEAVDESNPLISSIYPYKSPSDKNEDGYRYNLLPYDKSYSKHAATGTLPSRSDALTGSTAVEIYDKYYRYTTKTNESGDYMIMGVPLGDQTIVMDVDLSDIGEFSLTPQDLVRMGVASEIQVGGDNFKSSNDLNSLPQIVNLVKNAEISPLWGDPEVCQISINRLDFDLRDDANIDIQPTAVFMGSIFSSPDNMRIRSNGRPYDDLGNLCSLNSSIGDVLAIRQTINQDSEGNPILEVYQIPPAGGAIDGDGTWLTEIPMNLDYLITNEFGEKVISNDPTVGIPTKGKYRFKIKWGQSNSPSEQTRRPNFLVPNIREFGWGFNYEDVDPYISEDVPINSKKQVQSSYYFGLDWSGYTQGFSSENKTKKLNSIINCEDTFYQFEFNRVYTVSGFIDEYKKGGARGKFIGIKEIDSQDCESTINKFPVNDGFRNFDFLYFLFAIVMQIVQIVGIIILFVYHIIAYVWNNYAVPLAILLEILIGAQVYGYTQLIIETTAAAAGVFTLGLLLTLLGLGLLEAAWIAAGVAVAVLTSKFKNKKFQRFKLPMIQYPDCQACECEDEETKDDDSKNVENSTPSGNFLSQLSNSTRYFENVVKISEQTSPLPPTDDNYESYNLINSIMISSGVAGYTTSNKNPTKYKINQSPITTFVDQSKHMSIGFGLPYGERVNIFNSRKKYFDGINKIKVTFASNTNLNYHYDNTISVLSAVEYEPGTLLTFVSPAKSEDVNFLWKNPNIENIQGISGITQVNPTQITVNYATTQTTESSVNYSLPYGAPKLLRYQYPSDVEYYQVLTAITINTKTVNGVTTYSIPQEGSNDSIWKAINTPVSAITYSQGIGIEGIFGFKATSIIEVPTSAYSDYSNQKVLILQRGVDPYSPLYTNKFGIGKILGFDNEDAVTFTANTRLNIPIQKLPENTQISVQSHSNQSNIFYSSYIFTPGIPGSEKNGEKFTAFTTSNVGYYGALDANNSQIKVGNETWTSNLYTTKSSGFPYVTTKTDNRYYDSAINESFYDSAEDLSGLGVMYSNQKFLARNIFTNTYYFKTLQTIPNAIYFSPILYPQFIGSSKLGITNSSKIVMRTDRLPSSDVLDNGNNINGSVSLLQQNIGFASYQIGNDGETYVSSGYDTGAQTVTADIEDQVYVNNVIESLNTCSNMVGLSCYSGYSGTFGISKGCQEEDSIENGCYVFLNKPLTDLGKDIRAFEEWGYRFRFFYGLCRGVLSQSFVNNWVNGGLFMFPIQVDTYFDKKNKPLDPVFEKRIVYFDKDSNNFYYRSSPYYSGSIHPFVGAPGYTDKGGINNRNLLFPTTIMNLGIKDSFYKEIIFDPSANGYVLNTLNPTSYSDTSDLVNLFVISRIANSNFLTELIATKNNGLDKLFSRPQLRIDGDLAQVMSINSEYGVTPFSPQFYNSDGSVNSPVSVYGGKDNPTIGIFFSSTTQDLQNKDYLTPGVIDFRNNLNPYNAVTYPYGINSQEVPFYKWNIDNSKTSQPSIFGSQYNSWTTKTSDIIQNTKYQSLDRRTQYPNNRYYITPAAGLGDVFARGYLFNVKGNTASEATYSYINDVQFKSFLVGAPFHFYFGIMKGQSALDKFKTKYSISE